MVKPSKDNEAEENVNENNNLFLNHKYPQSNNNEKKQH
jgi:hypothetical protein